MSRIGCNVDNCAHNQSGACYANRISVTGKRAHTSNHTCCSSFLDQATYGNLTNSVGENDTCDYIGCNVKTCNHNAGNVCSLNNINVTTSSSSPNLYSETYCSSFECK